MQHLDLAGFNVCFAHSGSLGLAQYFRWCKPLYVPQVCARCPAHQRELRTHPILTILSAPPPSPRQDSPVRAVLEQTEGVFVILATYYQYEDMEYVSEDGEPEDGIEGIGHYIVYHASRRLVMTFPDMHVFHETDSLLDMLHFLRRPPTQLVLTHDVRTCARQLFFKTGSLPPGESCDAASVRQLYMDLERRVRLRDEAGDLELPFAHPDMWATHLSRRVAHGQAKLDSRFVARAALPRSLAKQAAKKRRREESAAQDAGSSRDPGSASQGSKAQ